MKIVFSLTAVVACIAAFTLLLPPRSETSDQTVTRWLESQRVGLLGEQFWIDEADPITLYAVRSWEVLIASPDLYVVRVESSTREGIPIIRLWRICLRGNKIKSVEPDQD